MKLGIGDFYLTQMSSYEFRGNWCCEIHTLLQDVNESCAYFLHFCRIWIKFGTKGFYKILNVF